MATNSELLTLLGTATPNKADLVAVLTSLSRGPGSFGGLLLRRHPNADVATASVYLDHADFIVMDDGTVVTSGLDDLSASIASAGAGGLDTGAEAASTWYEVYLIRKSGDGTTALLLHQAKDYLLDESQLTEDQNRELREGATTNVRIAQTFDVDTTGLCELIRVQLSKQGSPTGRIWISLYATTAGAPTGAALATSDKLDVSGISATVQGVLFVFRTPITLTAGTTYALALEGDYTASATVNIIVRENSAGGYAAGSVYTFDGTNWAADTEDLYFIVYITRNDAAVTMPAGYDQQAKIGYAYNDSSSDLRAFTAQDRRVRHAASDVGTVASAVPTLFAATVPLPPVAVEVLATVLSSVADDVVTLAGIPGGFAGVGQATSGAPIANVEFTLLPVQTEFPFLFLSRASGTGNVTARIRGFTW